MRNGLAMEIGRTSYWSRFEFSLRRYLLAWIIFLSRCLRWISEYEKYDLRVWIFARMETNSCGCRKTFFVLISAIWLCTDCLYHLNYRIQSTVSNFPRKPPWHSVPTLHCVSISPQFTSWLQSTWEESWSLWAWDFWRSTTRKSIKLVRILIIHMLNLQENIELNGPIVDNVMNKEFLKATLRRWIGPRWRRSLQWIACRLTFCCTRRTSDTSTSSS